MAVFLPVGAGEQRAMELISSFSSVVVGWKRRQLWVGRDVTCPAVDYGPQSTSGVRFVSTVALELTGAGRRFKPQNRIFAG
jgi:hypothetical protein